MIEERSCGAVMLRKNEERYEVLLVKHLASHWGFPKGHTDGDETEEETAIREVKEESGYDILLEPGFRETSSYLPKPGTHKTVTYFIGNIVGGEANCEEDPGIEKVEWFPYTEALALLAYQDDVAVLRRGRKYLKEQESDE